MDKKIDVVKKIIDDSIDIFYCPICKENMYIVNNSMKCLNNHTFDISKKGVVSLCKKNHHSKDDLYNKDLFSNRRDFILSGFYSELQKEVLNIIKKKLSKQFILDLGCGEGTYGFSLKKDLQDTTIIGIDLAKEGINLASDYLRYDYLPIQADINNIPFKNNTFDIIIDILSPISKEEAYRILKDDGIIIKVTPKKEYLIELRKLLNINDYENENVIEKNLANNYEIVNKMEIFKTKSLTETNFSNLIKMTPLTNHKKVIGSINKITIALNIYVLKKRGVR